MKETYNRLVSTNLSKPTELIPFITDEPKFHNYFCFPNENALKKYYTKDVFGQGYNKNKDLAKIKSVAEMLERLCLCNPPKELFASKFKKGAFQDPSTFFCYSHEQIPDKEKRIEKIKDGAYQWIMSKNLTTGREIYVPAQMIFLSYSFKNELTLRKEQISTGAALGEINEKRAFKSGFLESVERDGIMAFYLKELKGRKMKDFPKQIQEIINYLERYSLETHVFDVTTNLKIPTSLAMVLDKTGIGDAVNIGSKANLRYIDSIKGSIMESIQCRRLGRSHNSSRKNEEIPTEDKIISLEKRLIYWAQKERLKDIKYLIDEKPKISYKDLKIKEISLENAIESVKEKNFHILVTDITLPEIKQKGFEVLKVTIPELHPLYLNERARSLFSIHHGEIEDNPKLKPHFIT